MLPRSAIAAVCVFVGIAPSITWAAVVVPNASFEDGTDSPASWTLSRGKGEWIAPGAVGRRAVAVSGDGTSDNAWVSPPLPLAPQTVYRLQFQAQRMQGTSGLPISGPVFCNRDLGSLGTAWTSFDSFFVTPDVLDESLSRIRFGQWNVAGQVAFDGVRLDRVVPVYRAEHGLLLGEGEAIRGCDYEFRAPYAGRSANQSRSLAWHRCSFNSNRWQMSGPDAVVVYRHRVGRTQRRASVRVQVGWYACGQLVVAASRDGAQWDRIGSIGKSGADSFPVPDKMLPAEEIWVRLTVERKDGEASDASLQVNEYAYDASLDGEPVELVGTTRFVAVTRDDPQVEVTVTNVGDAVSGGRNLVQLHMRNQTARPLRVVPRTTVTRHRGAAGEPAEVTETAAAEDVLVGANGETVLDVPYHLRQASTHVLQVTLGGDISFAAETEVDVPLLHAAHYGYRLPGSTDDLGLWWCSSGWKVGAGRPLPEARGDALVIQAAANETEAAQLVLRPHRAVTGLRVAVSDLVRNATAEPAALSRAVPSRAAREPGVPGNRQVTPARIGADQVDVLRVRYVSVSQPTDESSTAGLWPDPLPPLTGPIDLAAGRNAPLWVRVHVPKGAAVGTYAGTIRLTADGYEASVPLRVHVFGFEMPDRMTCQTAFGLSTSMIERYHGLQTAQEKRDVVAKYHRCMSDHHIAPYDPTPYDPIRVTWRNLFPWVAGQRDEQVYHDGRASLRVDDRSPTENAASNFQDSLRIPADGLRLSFWYRTERAGHRFLVTLRHGDEHGEWMSGRNNDMPVDGDGTWQRFERTIADFPEGAKTVQLTLWATLWREDGLPTGTVWYDDVSLVEVGTGKELIRDGDFEAGDDAGPLPVFDVADWDRAMTRAVEEYHFNTFQLDVPGLGGGTFHARYEPALFGFSEDTPQYQAAMQSYLGQLEAHLRARGWLDEAFVYWFDEPDPKDYAFVMNGFSKLKGWAPELRRMLTEQVEPALVGGPNLWCPLSASYEQEAAQTRRQQGDTFWWYVCTGPTAPYCTLFIDHPGTELRVWLWQTWQRDIAGILVWSSNYWTSPAVYPDPHSPQNPYVDPMGWVSGYDTPSGTRVAWGNGDGRFLYPPESAADGRPAAPVLDGPVDSIRLEMLRDGIEDYEYLAMLSRLLKQLEATLAPTDREAYRSLLTVPAEITEDMTRFTRDPAPIESRREQIARAIERLTSREKQP